MPTKKSSPRVAVGTSKRAHKAKQTNAKATLKKEKIVCENSGLLRKAKAQAAKLTSVDANTTPPPLAAVKTEQFVITAWSESVATRDWVPQRARKDMSGKAKPCSCDRFDIAGTTNVNELVLRHGVTSVSSLKSSHRPALFTQIHPPRSPASSHHRPGCSIKAPQFKLDRYLSNLVRALVHPLHNFLQCHHGLHNADEVQVMLMPREGPIAAADRAFDPSSASFASSRVNSAASASFNLRRCYVATNNETLTDEGLQRAVKDWGVAGVFQISEFVLVRGEKGRHAEQKLLNYLRARVLIFSSLSAKIAASLTADQKAIVVGERLPCAACRLFAVLYEDIAVLLPSHGHMYLSTIAPSATALNASKGVSEEGRRAIQDAYASPLAAAKILLAAGHQRVLR